MKQMIKRFLARKIVGRKRARQLPVSELERLHTAPTVPGYNDSIYFAGWQEDGLAFVTRQAFRTGKPHENWLKVHIPGEGVWGFENRNMPAGEGFVQGPLAYRMEEPGKRWSLTYQGTLSKGSLEKDATLRILWEGTTPLIDFDRAGAILEHTASRIAAHPWNKEFFQKLKELHKVHYEQAGRVTGSITFDNKDYLFDGHGVRDHSFGKRSWQGWDRHIWFLGVLEDGRAFNASVIDYDFIRDLQAGYLVDDGHITTLAGVPSFAVLEMPEPLPHRLELPLRTAEEGTLLLETDMEVFFPFVMDGVYHIRQALARFRLDGVPGQGIAEMGINIRKYGIDPSY